MKNLPWKQKERLRKPLLSKSVAIMMKSLIKGRDSNGKSNYDGESSSKTVSEFLNASNN